MPITRTNLDEVVEADLTELVTAGASEGLALEFKELSYGSSDADKRELLKDVSAFANAHGGHLVLGMKEDRGIAVALPGVSVPDIDAETLRLGQIIRAGVEPPLLGFAVHTVQLSNAAHAIVIRVRRSWRPPHRVAAQGSNRFWIRNSSGCHEASVDELRSLFGQNVGAIEGARRFRDERLHSIQTSQSARPLVGGGRLVFHIVPQAALLSIETLDPKEIYKGHSAFSPLGSMGMSPRFNFEGVINERGGEKNHGYTQIFRSGALEATKASILRSSDRGVGIPGLGLEQTFFERYDPYLSGLRALGVEPPLVLMLSLEGVRGARYFVSNNFLEDDPVAIDRDVLQLPECVLTEYGPPAITHAAIRPAFDALWNAAGYPEAGFFSAAGVWRGKRF
jgi:hypothetical protein